MIKRHNEHWQLAPSPSLQWHERGPRSQQFDDIYFSLNDGVAESRYVFLEGVALTARIAVMRPGASLVIAETGFGTGLNFLLTLESWLAHRKPTTTLHYIGIDAYPLRRQDLERA